MSNNVIQGNLNGDGKSLAIVSARFNHYIVDSLVTGALDVLERHGVDISKVPNVKVPGCFEIPLVAKRLAESGRYDAIIALGAVIRGATPHFDYVAGECASGLQRVSLETGVPVAFGVLTTNTIEEAIERAGTKAGNKGADAAVTALEMADLLQQNRL